MIYFRIVLRHELLVAARSARHRVIFVVALALTTLASVSGTKRYLVEVRERDQLLMEAEREWLAQDPKAPHPANHFGRWVIKPIEPLSIFDRGVEDFVGQRIVLDAHVKTPLVGGVGEEEPLRALLGGFDLSFVAAVLLPLLLIFVAHDAICGEKERGTLRQLLAAPIPRALVFAAKFASLAFVALLCLGVPTVVGFAIPLAQGIAFDRSALAQMAWMSGALALYLAAFLGVSLAISASSARSSTALAALLGFWLLCTFLVPRTAELIAASVHPATAPLSLHRTQQQLARDLAEHRAERYRVVLEEIRKQHPEIPEGFGTLGHDGRHAAADPRWAVDPTGVFITEANALINEHRDRAQRDSATDGRRQQALAVSLAQASPTSSLMAAWSSLAATDWNHHQWFERRVDRYFQEFGDYFNQLWAHNVKELHDFTAAPCFAYAREPGEVARRRAARSLWLLLTWAVMATIAAAFRLSRCDAR